MPEIKQGDIFVVDIPAHQTAGSEQYNKRPWVVMSRLAINRSGIVVAVPLTSKTHKACQHRILLPVAEISKAVGSSYTFVDSVALTDQVRVLDVTRLEMPSIGKLSASATLAVQLGLSFVFDIR